MCFRHIGVQIDDSTDRKSGTKATATPSARATAAGGAPIVGGWWTMSSMRPFSESLVMNARSSFGATTLAVAFQPAPAPRHHVPFSNVDADEKLRALMLLVIGSTCLFKLLVFGPATPRQLGSVSA